MGASSDQVLLVARNSPLAANKTNERSIGTKLSTPTVLYEGWFGSRGLANFVFAVLMVTDADLPGTPTITLVASFIVGLNVLLHGVSAYPDSQAYANWHESHRDPTKLPEGK